MLTETASDTVSCAEAFFTLVDEGVPVDYYGRAACRDNITDPDLLAVFDHWVASHTEIAA